MKLVVLTEFTSQVIKEYDSLVMLTNNKDMSLNLRTSDGNKCGSP